MGSPGSKRLTGGVWGVKRGSKPAFLFWNLWRWGYGMCSAVWTGHGAFLNCYLIHYERPTGSLKIDSTDGLTPGWHYRHLPSRRHISIQCPQTHACTHTCTYTHTINNVHLCPSTPQDYLLWQVLQLHKHTLAQIAISHLCSCMVWCGPQGVLLGPLPPENLSILPHHLRRQLIYSWS